tara:strand:+ start:371 stop:670 length:300 start_codon:yes stop_codon:yes gene_type:complete
MAKELNPYSTSGSADYNENINKYMMDLDPFKTPLSQEGAVGPAQTTQINPADGTSVKTGETTSNIDDNIPKVYGPGPGNDVDSNTILYNEDEDPNKFIA